jgi:hypothetical protein
MDPLTDAQLEVAEAKGHDIFDQEPRAFAARYDRKSGRVVVDLANGCIFAFPASLVQDLEWATDDDLVGVQVDGIGP